MRVRHLPNRTEIRFADDNGDPIVAGFSADQANAAMMTYTGVDGHEEVHVFFTMGWFDTGAWPWAHYLNEWATKGVFMVREGGREAGVFPTTLVFCPPWPFFE